MARVFKIVAGVLVLCVLGAVLTWFVFDPNSLKPRIIAAVEAATGRALTIDGPIRLHLLPAPAVTVEKVSFANRPGGSPRPMATMQELEAHIAWLPLLSQRVEVTSLSLIQPDLLFETGTDGIGNWQFSRPEGPPTAATSSRSGIRFDTEIDRIGIDHGQLTWRDIRTGHDVAFAIPTLTKTDGRLAGTIETHEVPIQFTAAIAPLTEKPWPLDVSLSGVGGQATIKGVTADPMRPTSYEATIAADLPALDSINTIIPSADLPPLRDVKLVAHLVGAGFGIPQVSTATLRVGASDLPSGVHIATLAIAITKPEDPATLDSTGTLRGDDYTLSARFGPAAALSRFPPVQPVSLTVNLQSKSADLAADIKPDFSASPPKITGTVTSRRLDLDALITTAATTTAPTGTATTPQQAAPPPPPPPPPPPRMQAAARPTTLIPDRPFPVGLAGFAGVPVTDLQISFAQLIFRGTSLSDVAAHLAVTEDHQLRVAPFAFRLGSGTVTGSWQADAATPPAVAITLQGHQLPVEQLRVLIGEPAEVSGILDAHADLHGTGATPHALAATLDGRIGVSVVNGRIAAGRTAELLAPIVKGVPAGLDLQAATAGAELRCFALAATIKTGSADIQTLLLDSSALDVSGTGEARLGPETLDLRLLPRLRLGGNGIAVPLRLIGPWRDPKTSWDGPADQGKATFKAVIGALSDTARADACPAALAAARDRQPGAMPTAAPAVGKPKIPGLEDLLRGLTR